MKKQLLLSMIVCFFLVGYHSSAFAASQSYFSVSAVQAAAYPGETIRIQLSADSDNLSETDVIAAFRMILTYDNSKLNFVKAETTAQIQSGAFQYYSDGETVTGVYACDGISAPRLRGSCLTFVFSVPEDAAPGKTEIGVQIDQSADWSEKLIPQYDQSQTVPVSIKPALSQDAQLTDLVPSTGKLHPAFSPDIAEYTLRVGSSVSSIQFQADPASGASARISRRTLLRAGETTEIVITVTAQDKKAKSQYLVNVIRAQAPVSSGEDPKLPEPGSSSIKPQKDSSSKTTSSGTKQTAAATKSTASSKSTKTSSRKATSSKPAAAKTSSSKKASEKTSAEAPTPQQDNVNAMAPAGERNLYIMGGQSDAVPQWILAGCVMVLTGFAVAGHWKNRKKK